MSKYNFMKWLSISGMIGTVFLAGFLLYLGDYSPKICALEMNMKVKVFLWISMIPLFIMLNEFRKITIILQTDRGLDGRAIKRIVNIQWCLRSEMLLYVIGIILFQKLILVIIFLGIIIIDIFALLMKELLKQVVLYYEDSLLSI